MPLKQHQLGVRSSAQDKCAPTRALRIAEQNNLAAVAEPVSIIGRADETTPIRKRGKKCLGPKNGIASLRACFVSLFTLSAAEHTKRAPSDRHRSELGPYHSPQITTRHREKHTAKFATPLTPRPPCTKTPPHKPPATATK